MGKRDRYRNSNNYKKNKEKIDNDLINVLEKTKVALEENNFSLLKPISDNIIHNLSIFQNHKNISTAVTIYALSKVMERYFVKTLDSTEEFSKSNLESHLDEIIFIVEQSINCLKEGKTKEYDNNIKAIINLISCYDKKIHFYVEEVMRVAGIKKGARMYEHGISLGRTADVLGITQWELMQYVGRTGISDTFSDRNAVERYEYTKSLFE